MFHQLSRAAQATRIILSYYRSSNAAKLNRQAARAQDSVFRVHYFNINIDYLQ